MKKGLFLYVLVICLTAVMTYACGNAKHHNDGDGGGNPPSPTGLSLVFLANDALNTDKVFCTGAGLAWDASQTAFANHQAAIHNVQPGDYVCNIRRADGSYVVYSLTQQLWGATANGYALTTANIITNGQGGGNWTFTLHQDGSVTALGGVNPPPPVCTTPVATIGLDVKLKSYSNFVGWTPQVRFSGDSYALHPMNRAAANLYTYIYPAAPTNQVHTLNFQNPNTGSFLFDQNGNSGDYVVTVNGVQITQMLGNDLRLELDSCGSLIVPTKDLVFTFAPTATNIDHVFLVFGQGVFAEYSMTLSNGVWTVTLHNVPIGRYEANIYYMSTLLDVAVWPDQIKGTITINGTTMTTDDEVVYAQDTPLPDPSGTWLVLVRANLAFDLLANNRVVGVDLTDTDVIIIIPVPWWLYNPGSLKGSGVKIVQI